MEPVAYVTIGSVIGTALGIAINGFIRFMKQRHELKKDDDNSSFGRMNQVVDMLKAENEDRKKENQHLEDRFDVIKQKLDECTHERIVASTERELLERQIKELRERIQGKSS